ncbi:chemotaxis protein [Vibrio sp.]|uniref:chemotaxis protein n=1 Tax=Vibrio sp. TaxID=678 RepID=UPI003D121EB5
MYMHRLQRLMWVYLVIGLAGCSLLEVKIESQTVPLTKQELNMRTLTRDYAQQFFAQVELAADALQDQYDANDTLKQSYILLWKINAFEGMQSSAYQVSPMASLIDSWVFSQQMAQFYSQGAGETLFDSAEAWQVALHLNQEIDKLAQSVLERDVYQNSQQFVAQFVQRNPFEDLGMARAPAYRAWLEANQLSVEDVVTTHGTMPEAMGDMSDRLSLASEQMPKVITWKAQLLALHSSDSIEQLNSTLDSLKVASASLKDFIDNNPEYMANLAEQMAVSLQPLVDDIDLKTSQHLSQLSEERQALEVMVARERSEIAQIIDSERDKLTQDLDRLSQQLVNLAMDKLIELVKSSIIYFIAFFIVIFLAPLILGYALGKRAAVRADN